MKEKHVSMTNQPLTKQTGLLGTAQVSNKIRGVHVPEDKMSYEAIKYRISNRLKFSSIWINNKMSRGVINFYYSVENGTWLCDQAIIFQSSKNFLYNFIQSYKFIQKKHIHKKEK